MEKRHKEKIKAKAKKMAVNTELLQESKFIFFNRCYSNSDDSAGLLHLQFTRISTIY